MQHNFRFANELSEDGVMLKGLSNDLIKIKAGPVELNDKCLSCTGQPSHMLNLFKLACISYKPSEVAYRQNLFTRKKLLTMRRTLIDKCEELINSDLWPHGLQDLRTAKIFKDLM